MTSPLADGHCKPCEGGVQALDADRARELLSELHEDWELASDGRSIARTYKFPAYSQSLGFANAAAWVAIAEGHHPEITLNYGSCRVSYSTHAIDGLSDNDFICAAKTDRLLEP